MFCVNDIKNPHTIKISVEIKLGPTKLEKKVEVKHIVLHFIISQRIPMSVEIYLLEHRWHTVRHFFTSRPEGPSRGTPSDTFLPQGPQELEESAR